VQEFMNNVLRKIFVCRINEMWALHNEKAFDHVACLILRGQCSEDGLGD
jgi:hypothetical protein